MIGREFHFDRMIMTNTFAKGLEGQVNSLEKMSERKTTEF